MPSSYKGDPYWITARYAGNCNKCGEKINPGDRIFYYPKGSYCYKGDCAIAAEKDFVALVQDEDFYNA